MKITLTTDSPNALAIGQKVALIKNPEVKGY
jgi:hypothetical protein